MHQHSRLVLETWNLFCWNRMPHQRTDAVRMMMLPPWRWRSESSKAIGISPTVVLPSSLLSASVIRGEVARWIVSKLKETKACASASLTNGLDFYFPYSESIFWMTKIFCKQELQKDFQICQMVLQEQIPTMIVRSSVRSYFLGGTFYFKKSKTDDGQGLGISQKKRKLGVAASLLCTGEMTVPTISWCNLRTRRGSPLVAKHISGRRKLGCRHTCILASSRCKNGISWFTSVALLLCGFYHSFRRK